MVFKRIQALLAEQLNISPAKITMESDIINDLGADSLDVVEMLMKLEDEFKVTVPDEIATELKTIGSIADFVEANIKKK